MKNILLIFLGLFVYTYTSACDICGCAASNSGIGILPQFQKHFAGLRYQYSGFTSTPHAGEKITTPTVEHFQSVQAWGSWSPHRRIQIFGFVPYKLNKRIADKTHIVQGLGDVSLLATYMPVNTTHKQKLWKHALQMGLGIKLPTGKYDQVVEGLMLHPNIQAGTGSYDVSAFMQYTVRYKWWGSNLEFNYWHNGTNRQHFHFGNKTTAMGKVFVRKEWKKITFLPQLGFGAEQARQDQQSQLLQTHTGGYTLASIGGIDMYYKKIGIQLQARHALTEQLGEGHIKTKPQFSTNFIYLF